MYRITLTDVLQKVDFGVEINRLFFSFYKKNQEWNTITLIS